MLKIRRPLGRLIFNMGIAIPGKTVFLIETDPWSDIENVLPILVRFRSRLGILFFLQGPISRNQIRWKFRLVWLNCRLSCRNKILHMPRQHSCSAMCKIPFTTTEREQNWISIELESGWKKTCVIPCPCEMIPHLGCAAADVPVKFHSNWKNLNRNLVASRLHEVLR